MLRQGVKENEYFKRAEFIPRFGDRAIFQDVSFRLLKGEHIGLVGPMARGNLPL